MEIKKILRKKDFCQKQKIKEFIGQEYIKNPLLYENKKIDFRDYLIVYNLNPLKFDYIEGFGKISKKNFCLKNKNVF